jgi:hypothetical protein
MLASQLDPDTTLYYPMIVLERAFFAAGKLASIDKMSIGRDLFYMVCNINSMLESVRRSHFDLCVASLNPDLRS